MATLSVDSLFDAAIRILVVEEKTITLSFSGESISIRLPTTRRFADFLAVPHYYILPFFATMEEENLVTRAERVGILTTRKGTRKLIRMMADSYADEAESILGPVIFKELRSIADGMEP